MCCTPCLTNWSTSISPPVLVPSFARIATLLNALVYTVMPALVAGMTDVRFWSPLDRAELRGKHDRGVLLDEIAGLVELAEVNLPVRIGEHSSAALGAVGSILVCPQVHHRVHVACLAVHVGERLAEMLGLRREAVFLVDVQMSLSHA